MKKHWSEKLPRDACKDALAWAIGQKSPAQAWRDCKRGDWMLWLLGKQSGAPGSDSRRKLVLAACACARLALPYVRKGEERPRLAIETAEAWARGDGGVTLADVRNAAAAADAADAGYAAAYAAADAGYAAAYAAYAAADAASAAADAAYAAADAGYAAAAAADAGYAAAYAAYAAADADAKRAEVLAQCADIVRAHYPKAPSL